MPFSEHGIRATIGAELPPEAPERLRTKPEVIFGNILGVDQSGIATACTASIRNKTKALRIRQIEESKGQHVGSVDARIDKIQTMGNDVFASIRQNRHLLESRHDVERIRVEWLVMKCYEEIPLIVARAINRADLERQSKRLKRQIYEERITNPSHAAHLQNEKEIIEQQIGELNHPDAVWQIHLSELIGYLRLLQGHDPKTGSQREIVDQFCSDLWDSLEHFAQAATSPEEAMAIVDERRTGIAGLRALIGFFESAGIKAYYPKIEDERSDRPTSKQDVSEGFDLWVTDDTGAAAIGVQVKSHRRFNNNEEEELTEDKKTSRLEFQPVTPDLISQTEAELHKLRRRQKQGEEISTVAIQHREKKAGQMRAMLETLTKSGVYSTITDADLSAGWVEIWGVSDKGSIDPLTGEIVEGSSQDLDQSQVAIRLKSILASGGNHE